MKTLIQITMTIGFLSLVSCEEKEATADSKATNNHQEELEHWQTRTQEEIEKRHLAESEKLTSVSRAQVLEKVVIATGFAAVSFLVLGGAMGSKAKKDALNS